MSEVVQLTSRVRPEASRTGTLEQARIRGAVCASPSVVMRLADFCRRATQRLWRCLSQPPAKLIHAAYCTVHGVEWDRGWTFHGLPMLRRHRTGRIVIGKRFCAVSDPAFNSIGVSQRVIITACGEGSLIEIGDDVGMSGCSITARERIKIGSRVLIGSGALIMDNDAHPLHPDGRRYGTNIASKPVTIDDDVFVGARSIILKGIHVGHGAVIGAGSVVTKNVPAGAIVAGNPARQVRDVWAATQPDTTKGESPHE